MIAVVFGQLLLLQLALQPAVLAASQWSHQHQQDLFSAADDSHGRQLLALGGRGGFGGFRSSSRPTASRPAATPAYRPAAPAAPAGRTFGGTALPGGFSAYGRPGFRSTPFILPLALGGGLLAASAVSSLNNNPNAYCNGVTVQCYRAACEDALRNRCPDAVPAATAAANATGTRDLLVLSACPDTRYSECYRTPSFNDTSVPSFECFGVRRPRYGREDLAAVCHQPGGSNSAGAASFNKVCGQHCMLAVC